MSRSAHQVLGCLIVVGLLILLPPTPVRAQPPVITSIDPAAPLTNGGDLWIHGTGLLTSPVRGDTIILGPSGLCQVVPTGSDSLALCRYTEGPGGTGFTLVFIRWDGESCTFPFSYAPPFIQTLGTGTAPAAGGAALTIQGSSFGPAGAARVIRANGQVMTETAWIDHSTLVAETLPATPGSTVDITVEVEGQVSAPFPLAIELPTVSGYSPLSGPTQGGERLRIFGSNFGIDPGTPRSISVNGVACDSVNLVSDTEFTGLLPEGAGTFLPMVVTVAGFIMPTLTYNYLPPSISSITPPTSPPAGGTVITITGDNFGPVGAAREIRVDGQTIPEVAWVDHTRILALSPPGTPGSLVPVMVSVEGQASYANLLYDPPSVTGVVPSTGPTRGGMRLNVIGSNFGVDPNDPRTIEVGTAFCDSVSLISDTELTGLLPEGAGADLRVGVTIGISSSFPPGVLFSYERPSISGITPSIGPSTGGSVITITGQNFGPASASRSVHFGAGATATPVYLSHESLTATLPALPAGPVDVSVEAQGQISAAFAFTVVDPPVVVSVVPSPGPTAGGIPITIQGANFGSTAGGVSVGGAACTNLIWSASQIIGQTPEGNPGPAPVVVTSNLGIDSNAFPFSYQAPVVSLVDPVPLRAGGGRVTILGSNFGTADSPTRAILVGGYAGAEVEYRGHGELVVDTPPGVPGSSADLCVVVNGLSGCTAVSYAPPSLSSVTPDHGPAAGGTVITLRGSNFGVDPGTRRNVLVSGLLATQVTLESDSSLTCVVPPGQAGQTVDVSLLVEGFQAVLPGAFTYDGVSGLDQPAGPARFALHQNRPNPFASSTEIRIDLPHPSAYSLSVYRIDGSLVRRFEGQAGAGSLRVRWDGTADGGAPVPPGMYLYRFQGEGFDAMRKLVLTR